MKERMISFGGMVTALLASACCIGPALFLIFGITGLGFLYWYPQKVSLVFPVPLTILVTVVFSSSVESLSNAEGLAPLPLRN